MKRDYRLYLEDMLEAMDKIERYTRGLTFEQFSGDDKTVDAVIRGFTILGEATKNIPSTLRTRYPDVPWKDIAGMRDKLVHEYFGIRYEVLWETIKKRLPTLRSLIEAILKEMDEKAGQG